MAAGFGKSKRAIHENFDSSTIVELDDYFHFSTKIQTINIINLTFQKNIFFTKKDGFIGIFQIFLAGMNYLVFLSR